jgi:Ca-activated chloride channel family protein
MRAAEPVRVDFSGSGLRGWCVEVPGRRPLATPAVVDGRVFLGGGFGSHEFYAFDAATGRQLWVYQTHDDGPTAAVVADGLVAFNTESCELEVLTTEGRSVWKKWLGDPLLSMPAVGEGRIYMAYPDSRGDRRHYLACFELHSGNPIWKQPIAGEVITAPVLADGHVYLTTLDGTLYCFAQDGGQPLWHDQRNATSSPVVWKQQCYFSRRQEVHVRLAGQPAVYQTESLSGRASTPGSPTRDYEATRTRADWLDYQKRRTSSPVEQAHTLSDAHVGFAYSKGDAKMEQAMHNLGHGTVAGIWSYQGSKPFIAQDRLYYAMGAVVQCVDPVSEEVHWKTAVDVPKKSLRSEDDELLDGLLTPPVLVNDKVFVGTTLGNLACLDATTGQLRWEVHLGEPIAFQPAVAAGRVVVATSSGKLFGLETGDPDDDGWLMWGGDAAHNGLLAFSLQAV